MNDLVSDRIVVRRSRIHGRGVFAARRIRAGSRIIEYTGERIDDAEIEARYGRGSEHGHTMLFAVDNAITIDAARRGSAARYINHSCAGNCQAILDDGRIYIEALRNIQPGAELTYDYRLERPGPVSAEARAAYACRCGAPNCRGTLLYAARGAKSRER
jgi:SET domain-containing protein